MTAPKPRRYNDRRLPPMIHPPEEHPHTPGAVMDIRESACTDVSFSVCAVCYYPIQMDWSDDEPVWLTTWAAAAATTVQLRLCVA